MFIKLSLFAAAGFSLPGLRNPELNGRLYGEIGRIAADDKQITIHQNPSHHSPVVRKTDFDELLYLYYQQQISGDTDQPENWYRVWGGYVPGTYIQLTRYQLNPVQREIPECGFLAEVTVPYTDSFAKLSNDNWKNSYRLYYETNHWVTGIETGPDGEPWYELTSQLYDSLKYHVSARHLRPILTEEYLPTSITVPANKKRVEVSIADQTLKAFESDQLVFQSLISSGLGIAEVALDNPKATGTPRGTFRVTSKYPSKHMGGEVATGAPGSYTLPGVPWTTFFIYDTGVAIHGTYWHNNFGQRMSHGCINMRNSDAKWLFRWVDPPYQPPYKGHCDWYNTGNGTLIIIE